MSIFPFTQDVPELEERAAQELPVFRELAYDYENNCLKRKGGKTYLVEKDLQGIADAPLCVACLYPCLWKRAGGCYRIFKQ